MISTIIFLVILLGPFIVFLANALIRRADDMGIAGGIKKPRGVKTAKPPRPSSPAKAKRTAMRARRVTYCGRGLTHFALAVIGSQDACRYCGRLETVPPDGPGGDGHDEETDAVLAEVEQILDRGER
ncbi:MAG: hypothetical protein C0506_00575 [Anaerolinea sp.]|nr:hypothetical protein [Anaerolinea sp.]